MPTAKRTETTDNTHIYTDASSDNVLQIYYTRDGALQLDAYTCECHNHAMANTPHCV